MYGLLGVAGTLSGGQWVVALGHTTLLFSTVFLSFAMRELYYNNALASSSDDQRIPLFRLRRIELAFVSVIVVELFIVLLIDQGSVVALVKGGGSLSFSVNVSNRSRKGHQLIRSDDICFRCSSARDSLALLTAVCFSDWSHSSSRA
ncbi:hypothetical protein [Haladaptatus sp. DFWS20]|uniref:hypothetical protein n=1 Tax=Haladaptatus sp. DFWS20 TaxID=3403467 RepID=UPI003EC0F593